MLYKNNSHPIETLLFKVKRRKNTCCISLKLSNRSPLYNKDVCKNVMPIAVPAALGITMPLRMEEIKNLDGKDKIEFDIIVLKVKE